MNSRSRKNFSLTLWMIVLAQSLFLFFPARAQMTDVLTYHNDNGRTGQTLHEEILAPGNVNSNQFGELWALPTDGRVFAQPLYVAGIPIPNHGLRNVLFVASAHGSVFAFDADSTNILWQASLLGPGETAMHLPVCLAASIPEMGIIGTPVIDRNLGSNGAIFLETASMDSSPNYFHRLHALDLATGAELGPPTEITATYPGTGDNSSNGFVIFDPHQYFDRACLLLLNDTVYVGFSAHCEQEPATSWLMSFNKYTLAQTSLINLTPNGNRGSIWNSGGGPVADASGNIYVTLGNGTFDSAFDSNGFPANADFGNSLVKLSTAGNSLTVVDYFAMFDIQGQIQNDFDLGSGSPLLLPPMTDSQGNTRNLLVTASKDQNIYLADTSNLGKFNPTNNSALYQELPSVFVGTNRAHGPSSQGFGGGVWGSPAYFNNTVYFGPVIGPLTAYSISNGRLSTNASSTAHAVFSYPGAIPSISANGSSNGIVWALETPYGTYANTNNYGPAILHAYNATNLAIELYNSAQAPHARDSIPGQSVKFMPPTIASARVYVATTYGVAVFGLLDPSILSPLQQWRAAHFGNPSDVGAGANDASPSGDTVPNLVKYFLGLDPSTPVASRSLVAASAQKVLGQSFLTMLANRMADPIDVSFVAEVSTDLLNWNSSPSNTTILTNTPTQLQIRDNTPIGALTNQFLRLRLFPQNP